MCLQPGIATDDVDRLAGAFGVETARLHHLHPTEDRVQRRSQLVRQRGEEFVFQPARLLRRGNSRQLRLLAARRHHAHARHAYRPSVVVFDSPFAFNPANAAVRRDDAVLDVVWNALSHGPLHRCQDASAVLRVNLAFVAAEGSVEGARTQSMKLFEIVGPLNGLRRHIPIPGSHRRGLQRKAEACLAAARLLLSPGPLHGEGDLRCDDAGELELFDTEGSRHLVIEHELADHPTEADERDERHRRNVLGLDGRQKRSQRGILGDVADDDGLGIAAVGSPGRVAFHGTAIRLGQVPVRLEAHHPVGVDQKDRGTRHLETVCQRVQGDVVDFFDRAGAADRPCQREAYRYLRIRRGEH